MKEHALIVAGGKGTRFGGELPKQFADLVGKPVLFHTLEAFYSYSNDINIVLVLPKHEHGRWNDLVSQHKFKRKLILQEGGESRFQSVKRGLEALDHEGLVAIHDGVRPLVTPAIIKTSFEVAALHNSAVASVTLKESLRRMDDAGAGSSAVDRSRYRLIQTPQTFPVELLRRAYSIDEDPTLTDDASVVERAGFPISLFDGSYANLKITTREDLEIAATLLKGRTLTG